MNLPDSYPTTKQIPLPSGNVRFVLTSLRDGFGIETSHANPFDKGKMMEIPDTLSRQWQKGTNAKSINPSERPEEYMYLITSPCCAQHPDYKGMKSDSYFFKVVDPEQEARETISTYQATQKAMTFLTNEFGEASSDLSKKKKALETAVIQLGEKPQASTMGNYSTLLRIAASDPLRLLETLDQGAHYVESDRLAALVNGGHVAKQGSFYGYYENGSWVQIGPIGEANDLVEKPGTNKAFAAWLKKIEK